MRKLKVKFTRYELLAFVTYLHTELIDYPKRTQEWDTCYDMLVRLYKRGLDFNVQTFSEPFTYGKALAFGKLYLADVRKDATTFHIAQEVFAKLDAEFNLTAELMPLKMHVA